MPSIACLTDADVAALPAVDLKIIKTSYSSAAGTALVTFDNVRVPAKYVMGKENEGLKVILANFIHVRCVLCIFSYN